MQETDTALEAKLLKTPKIIQKIPSLLKNICHSSSFCRKLAPSKPQNIQGFTKEVLKSILIQYIGQEKDEKGIIFKNIGELDFKSAVYFGAIEITNQQNSKILLEQNNTNVMVSTNFYEGRVLTFAHSQIFKRFLVKDRNWTVFLGNVINWLTRSKPSSKEEPIKILMTTFNPVVDICKALAKIPLFVEVSYEQKISALDLQEYDCIFLTQGSSEIFSNYDCHKVLEYVREGGGLFIGQKGWRDEKGEYSSNKILSPMGLNFSEKSIALDVLKLQSKQKINQIEKLERLYTKQDNPLFIYNPSEENPLKETKKKLFEGVGKNDMGKVGMVVSSFNFNQSYMSLMKKNQQSFGVFGNYGKGKIFAFAHPGIFGTKISQDDSSRRLIQNIINWMTGNKKENISVGLLYQTGDDWWDYGWDKHLGMNLSSKFVEKAEDFSGKDIICVAYYSHYPKSLTPQVIEKLRQYVINGGSLFFGSHGWVWEAFGEYKKDNSLVYKKDFASYVLLKPFNIYLNKDYFSLPNYDISSNLIIQKDEIVQNFLKNDLLEVLKSSNKNSFSTSEQEVNRILSKISIVDHSEFEFICSIDLYHQIVEAFVESRFNVEKNYDQISFSDPFICKVFSFMNALSYAIPPHICRALPPSLNKYPGYATKRLKKKIISVSKISNKIVFTGLYLNPGEVIRVKHRNNPQDIEGVQLKVNFNLNLTEQNNGNLRRFTHVSRTYEIKLNQFLIASPHGGIIYFEIEEGSLPSRKPLSFTFEGAYEGVYWNENIHSYADFERIKKIDAPIFIIETQRINLIGPTKGLFSQLPIPIERLSKYWNKVIGVYKDYRGIEQYPFHKDAIFNDMNIVAGYMHAGNPVMTYDDVTSKMIGLGEVSIFEKGDWGFYHEFGHNHQDGKWTVNETVQVTCNIFTLYLMYRMHGYTVADFIRDRPTEITQQLIKSYFELPVRTMKEYSQINLAMRLVFYAIIMEELGYQTFSPVHKAFDSIELPDETYETKFDNLVEQTSLATKHNLWNYFKSWGMPVTNASLLRILHLAPYSCKRYPFITDVANITPIVPQ